MNPTVTRCFHCLKCLIRKSDRFRKTLSNLNILNNVYQVRTMSVATKPEHEWIEPVGKRTGLLVYNSLTKRKDELILPKGNTLSWYVCGPTVYDASHIGHASNYVRYDIVRRILTNFFDINVIYLMGITDIDDKIITKANLLEQEFTAITSHYEREFFQEMLALNIMQPTATSRVTDYVQEIIDFIQTILNKGHAYVAEDKSVYFDVVKYGNYDKFVPGLANTATPGDPGVKRSVRDFALWKSVKPGEPYWSSPWGPGRPGWHIECSAMASRVFGSSIDIHSGGMDLMFPHHENELAQSCSYHDVRQWANYWMHTGHLHLQYDPDKMSKSLNNVIATSELLEKYSANQFRMFCMLTHYRNNIEFTDLKMEKAIQLDNKIGNFLQLCNAYIKGQSPGGNIPEAETMQKLAETEERVRTHLKDDFNTPEAMTALFDLISNMTVGFSQTDGECRSPGVVAAVQVYVKRLCKKLGFHKKGWKMSQDPDNMKLKEVLDNTVKFRWNVRNFAIKQSLPGTESLPKKERKKLESDFFSPLLTSCDNLRSELSHCKISVKDHKTYSSWEFVNAGTISDESQWEEPDSPQISKYEDQNIVENDKNNDSVSQSSVSSKENSDQTGSHERT
ncbi:probable cysteine--tRNA ligase, mitochondrial [Mercenaria mercenaria]|uniref:probable cysteine--tRNA ligase, mitochondrial n=1 Tax=Mercenaria mercenaria TaxID=6596 RepID=UPI00234F7E29|nr:probable cysteine--tRNA ligase, mitochondrial [Mercenaria mercenaria]